MSISSSISAALSGLQVTARTTEVISTNLANALSENYGLRELHVSSRGGNYSVGVKADGIERIVDKNVLQNLRERSAESEKYAIFQNTIGGVSSSIGLNDEIGSFSSIFDDFSSALIASENDPSSESRLTNVISLSTQLVNKFGHISDNIQVARSNLDKEISEVVNQLNRNLNLVDDLNTAIIDSIINNRDTASLLDQRQALISQISDAVPVREIERGNGAVSLISRNGGVLLESSATNISFSPTPTIVAEMTVASGALSELTLGTFAVSPSKSNSYLSGGKIESLFSLRDSVLVGFQQNLDEVAYEIITSFESVSDPTRAAGQPALFTDNGGMSSAANIVGLSSRLAINGQVDESAGGSVNRLRDGLYSATIGNSGDTSILTQYVDLTTTVKAASAPGSNFSGKLSDYFGAYLTAVETSRLDAEQKNISATTHFNSLNQQLLSSGVDTDTQLQKLLEVEKNYSANAKVLQTIDVMLDSLLEVV